MKKIHKSQIGLVAGVALLGYGAGLVSVQPSQADDNGRGGQRRGFDDGPRGERGDDMGGPGEGPGGPGGGRGGRGGGPGRMSPDGKAVGPMLHELLDDLDLSDAQQTKIENAQDSERTQMDALRKQMEQIQQKTRASIDAALTADQRKQLEKSEKEMAQNSRRGPGGPGGRRGSPGGGPGGREDDDAEDGGPGGPPPAGRRQR